MNPSSLWKKAWKTVAGLVGLIALMLWAGGAFSEKEKPGHVKVILGRTIPPGAARVGVTRRSFPSRVDVVGTVASEQNIHISARIAASINEVFASAGTPVRQGQRLASLDDREIREQLAMAEEQFKLAETESDRTRQLFEKNAATDQALTAAKSSLAVARAQVERMRVLISYAHVSSPIDGIVANRRVEAGDLASPGQILMTVFDPARMRLEAPVPVRLLESIRLGQDLDVTLDVPARTFQGRVEEIVSEIDPLSRTREVRVRIESAGAEVLPGSFGRIWVEDKARDILAIPASAVFRAGQNEFVDVARGDRAIRRLVKTGPRQGDEVEILAGLQEGESVLTEPLKETPP